jgi:uncharacterized membrane protein
VNQEPEVASRGWLGLPLLVVAVIGLLVAAYLLGVRLVGEAPACGPVKGCETVAVSEYSEVLGIPVAAFGLVFSLVLAGATLVWWLRADRRALLAAYGLGLLGTLAVGYLTYLELFVIYAICIWCVTYAVAIVSGLALTAIALRRT